MLVVMVVQYEGRVVQLSKDLKSTRAEARRLRKVSTNVTHKSHHWTLVTRSHTTGHGDTQSHTNTSSSVRRPYYSLVQAIVPSLTPSRVPTNRSDPALQRGCGGGVMVAAPCRGPSGADQFDPRREGAAEGVPTGQAHEEDGGAGRHAGE